MRECVGELIVCKCSPKVENNRKVSFEMFWRDGCITMVAMQKGCCSMKNKIDILTIGTCPLYTIKTSLTSTKNFYLVSYLSP